MSTERILGDLGRREGMMANRAVYFGNVNCQELNGIPISSLKTEGNDKLAPSSYSDVYHAAQDARAINYEENKAEHDYDYGVYAMAGSEKDGLPGISKSAFLWNSAIGSKKGGVFGNKVNVISAYTNEESEMNPFSVTTNTVLTDTIKKRHEDEDETEPCDKKIKMMDGVSFAKDKVISFEENEDTKQTVISQGKIVTSEIGDPDVALKVHASEMEVDSDIILNNANKIVTSQIESDDYGTLELKASHIQFTANNISFDPDSTEIVTGNFPQVISNLSDYERTHETVVCTYRDPKDKTNESKSIVNAMWRLQMFYNLILTKITFDWFKNEEEYKKKMGGIDDNSTKELYVNFPSEFYSHFVDYYGKEDKDNYITSTELLLHRDSYMEVHKRDVSVYFNAVKGAFLVLKIFNGGAEDYWPRDFAGHEEMSIGNIQFTIGVKAPRLKRKYSSTTPSTFMNRPDYYEAITPRLRVLMAKSETSNIYTENKSQQLMINEDISSSYKLQAIISAIKIQKLAFFEIRYSFVDENTNNPIPFNDALKVIQGYKYNPKQFLITFVPNGEISKFMCSDNHYSEHIISGQANNVKFRLNPKSPVGLYQGIIDFSEATTCESDNDVGMTINFYYVTEK